MGLYGKIIGFPNGFVGTYVREVSAFMQYWGQLEDYLSLLGAILVRLWTVLGPTSSILGLSWSAMRLSWCVPGLSWSHFTANLGQPSNTWSRSKAIWNRLGANLSTAWAAWAECCFKINYPGSYLEIEAWKINVLRFRKRFWVKLLADLKHRLYQCVGDGLGRSIDR